MFVLPHELPEVGGPGAPTAPHAHGTGHAHHLGGTDAAARVAELAPSAAQRIVVTTTPHPNRFRGPDQRLLELGVIDDMQGGMHAARIQAALARIGLRIRRTDVVTGPAITVSGCTDSVLEHATS